jgi:uncharacterized phage infection (PIP) family protein YhgE
MSSLVADSTNLIIQNVDETIKNYHKLSNLYNLYFGLDVSANLPDDFSQSSLSNLAKSDSLYYLFNKSDMVDILAEYVANQTVEGVRQQTQDLKDKMDSYIQLINSVDQNSAHLADVIKQTTEQANSMNTNLAQTIKDLAAWREASRKLVGQQTKIMSNEDGEQTAILGLDGEFKSILVQSQSLADQSKSTLTSADDVYKTFDTIDNQAKTIQASGNELVNNAASLSDNLSKKLTEDKDFLRNFVKVLPNSRIGERQNENLFSFLANPVQTKNDGVVVADNRFTPYLLVLICFLVSLFTAYVISNQERKRIEENAFEEGKSLTMRNLPITSVQMGIGIVEGIVIGGISGYLLKISNVKFLIWMSIFIIIMLLLILVLGYLLRQMKMVGMFILLVILSLYLFLTDAVGQNLDKLSLAAKIRQFSPLQYIENLLTGFINGREDWSIILYGLVAAVIIGLIANLYVIHKYPKEGDEHEANTQTN